MGLCPSQVRINKAAKDPQAAKEAPQAAQVAQLADTSNVEMASKKRWVWAAIDPVNKLLLACVVFDLRASCAQTLIHIVVSMLAAGCMPLSLIRKTSLK